MRKLDIYWQTNDDWYYYDGLVPRIKDDAPEEAKESYQHYLQQKKELYGE